MSRHHRATGRRLLRAASLSIALLAALTACDRLGLSGDESAAADSTAIDFDIAQADVSELSARMARGQLSSHALTQAYLTRIAQIDDAGPQLNAVIELNPDALKEADARDAERKAGRVRGPLHGIPVLVKDNIDATPMVTSAGSLALASHRPKQDAFVIARLRDAGAVILGKTNLSEWANFRSSQSVSGWSARGGLTRNPYVLDRSACGSSSGTGSAIAAGLAVAGLGTETDGSILCPAAVSGLVGLKPTVGLVSRSGIVPISSSQDTPGPMARSVSDAAFLLAAMVGRDESDAVTGNSLGRTVFDYPLHLKAGALRGARIGVLRKNMGFDRDVDAAMERAIDAMRRAGAVVVDAEIPTEGQWSAGEIDVLLYEFKPSLEHYLASREAPVRTLAQIIDFNKRNARKEMPYFGQDWFEQAELKGPLGDPVYLDTRSTIRRLAGPEGIDAALRAQQLDALITPTTSAAWPVDTAAGDPNVSAGYGAAAVAGYPSLTVPMGDSHGLPLGMVFMGTAWSEPRLIELGYAFEQLSKARKAPKFLATLRVPNSAIKAKAPAAATEPAAAAPAASTEPQATQAAPPDSNAKSDSAATSRASSTVAAASSPSTEADKASTPAGAKSAVSAAQPAAATKAAPAAPSPATPASTHPTPAPATRPPATAPARSNAPVPASTPAPIKSAPAASSARRDPLSYRAL